MPPSTFEQSVHPQMLPDSIKYQRQYTFDLLPANVTQLPHTMSQHSQKRDFSDLEYANNTMLVPQHRDPTFFGLSASLPMSTYSTQLSPPPQTPRKKHRQSNQDIQGGSMPPQRLPQTNTSHVHRSVPSARPRPVYSKHSMPSRRGTGPTERDRPRHLPQQSTFNVPRHSAAFANPYMSDPPPSWNWINEQHALGGPMKTPGIFDSNFRFHWPNLDGQSHYNPHLQSMQQHPMQMPHTLVQRDTTIPAANSGMSHFTPDQLRAFEASRAVPEIGNYSLEGIGAQMDHVGHAHGFLAQQSIEILRHCQGKTPSPPDGINSDDMDTGSNSRAKYDLTDFAHLRAVDAYVLEELAGFDDEFNFDCKAFPNTGGNSSEVVDTEVESRDSNDTPDASEECELARLLAPVAEYLSFRGYDHSENSAEEVASGGISGSHGAGLGSTHDMIARSNSNDSLPSRAKLQSPVDLDLYTTNATARLPNKHVSKGRLDQTYIQKGSLLDRHTFHEDSTKDSSLSKTPNASNGTSAGGQATVSNETSMSSSPADLGIAKSCWPIISTTAYDTILSSTSAIDTSASENLQMNSQEVRSAYVEDAEEVTERVQSIAVTDYDRFAEKLVDVRSDMTDWVNDRFPADARQPIATNFKMPRISPARSTRVGIYGRQVIWGSGRSQLGKGQEETMTPAEKDKLRILQETTAQPQE